MSATTPTERRAIREKSTVNDIHNGVLSRERTHEPSSKPGNPLLARDELQILE
jgi:hypothetical protein